MVGLYVLAIASSYFDWPADECVADGCPSALMVYGFHRQVGFFFGRGGIGLPHPTL